MARLVAAAHAFPPFSASQGEVREVMRAVFNGKLPELERLLGVFDHARIDRRQFMRPLHWYRSPAPCAERNRIYLEEGGELLQSAAAQCLERAGCPPSEVDHVICVSTTGLATPSLDARLINALGLPPKTTRLPIWGLGCAGGAAGLARAFDYCRAYPRSRVLLGALETCSLTFREQDVTRKNLVGTAIFADGAAAVLVAGEQAGTGGPRLVATASHLFPGTDRIMGWDFPDFGMELVLSPRLPVLIRQELPRLIEGFLERQGLRGGDLVHYLTHPGGARVIDAYREALGLTGGELRLTEELLRRYGNLSSVSVLVVLENWLASAAVRCPGYGLLSAFGPGFSAEQLLLEV